MTRDERKQQLLRLLSETNAQLTISQLCRRAGIRKTPYAVRLIDELFHDGLIEIEESTLVNGLPVFLIEVA